MLFSYLKDYFRSLPRDLSRDMPPLLGVSVILQCSSFRVHAPLFLLLLLRLCSNSCTEALVV